MHTERGRAESFGSVAEQYDRFRPSYPAALIEDLIALGAAQALDVGCGTGKAGRLLAARGMSVLGVEIDPEMAEVARRHGLDVEVSSFEDWDASGRRFDLVLAGQAWHWLDPAVAVPKAATVLRPGGTIAVFWNIGSIDEPFETQLDGVYRFRAPQLLRAHEERKESEPPYVHDLDSSKLFEPAFVRDYEWQEAYSTEHWVQMVQTHSDHVTLDAKVRAAVIADVADVIDANGGQILTRYRTHAVFAHVPSP
jgi:SAM-dependent methyltransferase